MAAGSAPSSTCGSTPGRCTARAAFFPRPSRRTSRSDIRWKRRSLARSATCAPPCAAASFPGRAPELPVTPARSPPEVEAVAAPRACALGDFTPERIAKRRALPVAVLLHLLQLAHDSILRALDECPGDTD